MCRKLWKHPKSIRNPCLYLNNLMYKSIYIQFVYFLQIHTSQCINFSFKGKQIASIAPSEKAKRIELFTNNGITRRQAKCVCKLHKLLVVLVPKTQNKTITRSRSCPRTTRSGTRGRVHTEDFKSVLSIRQASRKLVGAKVFTRSVKKSCSKLGMKKCYETTWTTYT